MLADQARRFGLRPAAAIATVKSVVGLAATRTRSVLSDAVRGREQWVERQLPLDLGVSAAARRVVVEALSDRMAVPVVNRAQLLVSELVSHGMLHAAGSAGEITVRLRSGRAACRIEVETDGPPPAPISHPYLQTLSERWGFERTARGATRTWAELTDVQLGGEYEEAAAGRAVGTTAAEAAEVHVVPNERAATWEVYDARMPRAMSEHSSETEAEAAARMCARVRGRRRVVIHDRYHRTRETLFELRE